MRKPARPPHPLRSFAPLLLCGIVALAACEDLSPLLPEPDDASGVCYVPGASAAAAGETGEVRDSLFARAGEEFGVPVPLLKAISFAETRWQMVDSEPEFPGQPPVYGLMGLKGDQLAEGAALAGVSPEAARFEPESNIRAGAALLRRYAEGLGVAEEPLAGWAPAVAEYSRIALDAGRTAYVHDDVYATLRRGVRVEEAPPGARVTLAPLDVRLEPPLRSQSATAASVDHPGSLWRASPNFNGRPGGAIGRVAMIIIHTCEGSYTGCWSWLANPDSRVSAHYVVKEDGSEIVQMVREADRAWHIGSSYDCTLNGNFECWRNGQSNNHFTVGIEHAGFASQRHWPVSQLDASARLVCGIVRRHDIPLDNLHILGHAQLQPHNRTDPGKDWPWAEYLARVRAHCGGASSGEIVVDSDNASNASSVGYLSVSGNWISTRATPGYWGGGYHFASTRQVADPDPAAFHFYLAAPQTRTVDAWWTAGSNRSPSATFRAVDAHGREAGTVRVNQQEAGSRWNTLGTWSFPAGWNTIELSRSGPAGCVVIADAIRVR